MSLARRRFLRLTAAAVLSSAAPRLASANKYPTRPVRILVGSAAGGGIDMLARLMGQWLSERFGRQFIVENRSAGSNIATEAVVHAQADGQTLLLVNAANAINATLYPSVNFDFIRDIAPVGGIMLNRRS